MCVCVCVHICMRMCVCACVHACVCLCVCALDLICSYIVFCFLRRWPGHCLSCSLFVCLCFESS